MTKLATDKQLYRLRMWYERAIGYWPSVWYIDYLQKKSITIDEASKEMNRLYRIRKELGSKSMFPINWEKIKPSEEELEKFIEEL